MVHTDAFTSLLVVSLLAAFVPMALSRFKKLRIPIVVGEIIAGMIVGRSGFNLVLHDDPILEFLSEFGLVFLMFLSGMEIDFSNLRQLSSAAKKRFSWTPVTIAFASFFTTLGLSAIVGFVLLKMDLVTDMWMMALILSTTSLGVVVPILKERNLICGNYGQTLLVSALIADFATMLLITVFVAGFSLGSPIEIILLILVLFAAFFLAYRLGGFMQRIERLQHMLEELSHATAQIKVRISIALMFAFVALSGKLGAEIILGAFLAGAIISLLSTPSDAEVPHQLETIGFGFLIPIFFITVGAEFNLGILFSSNSALILVPLLFASAYAIKIISAFFLKTRFSWRETLGAGVLLSSRLSLIIAAVAIGNELGIVSEAVTSAIILVAIITVTLSPMLFNRIIPEQGISGKPPYVIFGANVFGLQIAEKLIEHKEEVIILDDDKTKIEDVKKKGLDARFISLKEIPEKEIKLLNSTLTSIVVFNNPDKNYDASRIAKQKFGISHVVACINNANEISKYENIGVRPMNAVLDRSALVTMLARHPATYDLMTRAQDNKEMIEITINNAKYIDKRLREIVFPGDVLVLAIYRNGELLVPHGDTTLQFGDKITLLGTDYCLEMCESDLVCY
jgi:Kef-type K+ transport system membrane component KefB/Trk K+ transport system NAD-binding subunit